ncbi:16S rRNA (guanine(527)-N(7))-methyltransferase RsmG [Roseovarius sp. A21]|uniref:Ribosomal RNA small subunit methyltransferase G n=1 Tax=Roseovarius bejariae TaxID=2576383 RepID=A0A844D2T9_9RHOB|nr:16S rRNA (guanine(527)-N(7))-methyltransferase RsmG [Roseovarius bejariae]MRU15548.1 16S rRNA (guanine(527)-N(7))-methyltransferase RsmG [Roseovarius bejariae]
MRRAGLPFDVSRETSDKLEHFADLLLKWNPRINLVSRSTLDDLWARHILDSAQIYDLAPHPVTHWADLGSGGGFPGLVLAILGAESGSPKKVTLVESDVRKCAFLRTVIRETGVSAQVINDRIEDIPALGADVLSARALADLPKLLAFTERHLSADGTALFPKGATWEKELQDAQSQWNFEYRVAKSKTEDGPAILAITGVSRV